MSLSDRMPIAGRLPLPLTDADGRVVEERRVKNLITLKGRAFLARSFAGLGATSVDMSSGSAEHTLREAGIVLLTGPQGAERTLFNRAVFEPITKTERLSLTVGWELVF